MVNVVNGENRDTAWYSITDADWSPIRARNPGSPPRTSTPRSASAPTSPTEQGGRAASILAI